ncbi:MAG TPA: serine/threonine-protein kinase [Gemmataceae bacterium]|nr:serine/threonine-protein kinase [Gemmataceae bacterium]
MRPRADQTPSTQNIGPPPDPGALTPLASPAPSTNEPPTVISGNRPRTVADPRLGDALAGRKLGHFELIEAIGAGGMAAVLKARDLDLGRVVALKILPPDMAADPENIVRFKQEARAAAKLDDDNVARVYFFGEDQGLHFIAFEFVEGDNLRQLMEANGGTIPVRDAVAIMLQVTAGLAHAAERGVVHRDIKPSNIIVTPDGRAKIVDMGLARSLDARHAGQLTQSGVTLGTFDYISPEQAIEPRSADVRSDIYSLGCTFYHAMTGHVPVPEGTAAKKLDAQKNVLPPDPRVYNPAIPADLAAVLGRMMAKDPDRRYQHPEHLAAHLRAVARKLGVPIGPLPSSGVAIEEPLGPPPRLSVAWVITALAVMAFIVVVISNMFPGQPPAPPWPAAKGTNQGSPDAADSGLVSAPGVALSGPQEAADTAQLVALLKQGARHIKLTGTDYDLVKERTQDGHPVEAVLAGDDVRLEGGGRLPTVRLKFAPNGKARAETLTLRGPGGGKGSAMVRGIRFVFPDKDGSADEAGLLITGFDRVTVEDCTFTRADATGDGRAGLAVALAGGAATVNRCYFAPGAVAVAIEGPGRVTATECAIAPHQAGFRVTRPAGDESGDIDLTLRHCSALLTVGAVVEVGDGVPCTMQAGYCLFAGPTTFGPTADPVVVRQRGTRSARTEYRAAAGAGGPMPNGYHHVDAYAEGGKSYSFADAAREQLPVQDAATALAHPWKAPDPFSLLRSAQPGEAKKAFTQDLRLAALRIPGTQNREILGTMYIGPERLYPLPLSDVSSDSRDLTVKVWDPSLRASGDALPPGVFPTLKMALAAVQRGDTLLIRYTGLLDVDPCEFEDPETNLTIKPDANSKPVLRPARSVLKRAAGLFKVFGGRLVLDGIHFRLPADRAPAVAVLPGGGQLEVRNAVITFEDGEDLAAVALTDPRTEMMMGTPGMDRFAPRVTLENMVLRGRGRLLAVKGSRPFDLDVKNALAALDHNLIDIDPSTADMSTAGGGVVRLTRVTTYLAGSLLHLTASDRKAEMGPAGLARTDVMATGCVFVPAADYRDAFVRADRIDTPEQVDRVLTWKGKDCVYGYDKKKVMLDIRPADMEAMPPKLTDGDWWLSKTLEEGDPFARVVFAFGTGLPKAGGPFAGVRPGDLRVLGFDPQRMNDTADVGAPADLPPPYPDD